MSYYSSTINDILDNGPVIKPQPATITQKSWNSTFNANLAFDPALLANITNQWHEGYSGVYAGTISSLGNMVATALGDNYLINKNNAFDYKCIDSNENVVAPTGTATNTVTGHQYPIYPLGTKIVPWLSGYLRTYWTNPQKTTFGANSAIPAITGVVPEGFQNTMPGSFVYYVDLQTTRLTGGQYWYNNYAMNAFNQLLNWVNNTNKYNSALVNSENQNLQYHGVSSYNDLVTHGWSNYKSGSALITAFNNLGVLVETIPLGYFGTSNAVAKSMIDHGLGAIGNLSNLLHSVGISYSNIWDLEKTKQIDSILETITDPNDLTTIQEVLQTTVPAKLFKSPLSYTSIEITSGQANDSKFASLADVGTDMNLKNPGSTFTLGSQVSQFIVSIQSSTADSIEQLNSDTSLLSPEFITALRTFLPANVGSNQPISILNVIGTATGYYANLLENVNEGLAELAATSYGPQITTVLSEISRYLSIGDQANCLASQSAYFALLNTIAADPKMAAIVNKINSNYTFVCSHLESEHTNYNKANFVASSYNDNGQLLNFTESLPTYTLDANGVGADYFWYQLCQPNAAGNVAQNLMNYVMNSNTVSSIGGKITGLV